MARVPLSGVTMVGKTTLSVLAVAILSLGLARYFVNSPHIFDLFLADDFVYMGAGTDFQHAILWPMGFGGILSSCEYGGFYSEIYRFLSFFLKDPIDLYLEGGLVILLAAVIFGFLGI